MIYHIYCDESRQSKDRYMVLGGLIIPEKNVHIFNATMAQYRIACNMHAELKWCKVATQKAMEYRKFVDYFFALNNTDKLHFHCIIFDNHQINHKKYNGGDKELGFYKFYYQLLLHCFGRKYYNAEEGTKFIIHLDYRNSKYKLSSLQKILNHGLRKAINKPGMKNAFVSIEPLDSKSSELIQVNDIILGAIGYQKNGYHIISGAKQGKIEVMTHISQSAGLADLCSNTRYSNQRFTIWNFRLGPK